MTDKIPNQTSNELSNKLAYTDGGIPPVDISGESPFTSNGFFDALSEGQLLGGRCTDCNEVLLPPRPACYQCGGRDVTIQELPRHGTVISYTRIHKSAPAFADITPFLVAILELDSGGRLIGRVGANYDNLSINDRMHVDIRDPTDSDRSFALDHEEGWPILIFVPANE